MRLISAWVISLAILGCSQEKIIPTPSPASANEVAKPVPPKRFKPKSFNTEPEPVTPELIQDDYEGEKAVDYSTLPEDFSKSEKPEVRFSFVLPKNVFAKDTMLNARLFANSSSQPSKIKDDDISTNRVFVYEDQEDPFEIVSDAFTIGHSYSLKISGKSQNHCGEVTISVEGKVDEAQVVIVSPFSQEIPKECAVISEDSETESDSVNSLPPAPKKFMPKPH